MVAVNTDRRESQFEAVNAAVLGDWVELAAANPAIAAANPVNLNPARNGEGSKVTELWRWALVLLVLLVVSESLLGNAYFNPAARSREKSDPGVTA